MMDLSVLMSAVPVCAMSVLVSAAPVEVRDGAGVTGGYESPNVDTETWA